MTFGTIAASAGVLLALSAASAAAAPALAINNVNLRQGPGTTYTVIMTIPGGSNVDVSGCSGQWCQVTFQGQNGYAIATSFDQGGGAPPPGAAGPPPAGSAGPPAGPPPCGLCASAASRLCRSAARRRSRRADSRLPWSAAAHRTARLCRAATASLLLLRLWSLLRRLWARLLLPALVVSARAVISALRNPAG